MRCIFCKNTSAESKSVEHIIPESLGNTAHTLPPGIVCDKCNQYFALKVEKPVLDSSVFRSLRSTMDVPNKKRRIPVPPNENKMELPEYRLTARLLGKIGLEALASRTKSIAGWEEEIIDKPELDAVRDFTRFDRGPDWPFVYRPIYLAESVFYDGTESYEVLHEYDLLYTKGNELYIVVVLFGVELALNLGGPEIDGYNHWLASHKYASPLYVGKNAEPKN